MDQLRKIINDEISWCVRHQQSAEVKPAFASGFIAGLRQAVFFMDLLEKFRAKAGD